MRKVFAISAFMVTFLFLLAPAFAHTVTPSSDLALWWDTDYSYRKWIEITPDMQDVSGTEMVRLQFNHRALVSAGKSKADGSDVRLMYVRASSPHTWTEIPINTYFGKGWDRTDTQITFKIFQPSIAYEGSPYDKHTQGLTQDNFYLYYGNPNSVDPLRWEYNDTYYVPIFDDFEDGNMAGWGSGGSSHSSYVWEIDTNTNYKGGQYTAQSFDNYHLGRYKYSCMTRWITPTAVEDNGLEVDNAYVIWDWRIDGEGSDALIWYFKGSVQNNWQDYQYNGWQYDYTTSKNRGEFKFCYKTDYSGYAGTDTAFMDNFRTAVVASTVNTLHSEVKIEPSVTLTNINGRTYPTNYFDINYSVTDEMSSTTATCSYTLNGQTPVDMGTVQTNTWNSHKIVALNGTYDVNVTCATNKYGAISTSPTRTVNIQDNKFYVNDSESTNFLNIFSIELNNGTSNTTLSTSDGSINFYINQVPSGNVTAVLTSPEAAYNYTAIDITIPQITNTTNEWEIEPINQTLTIFHVTINLRYFDEETGTPIQFPIQTEITNDIDTVKGAGVSRYESYGGTKWSSHSNACDNDKETRASIQYPYNDNEGWLICWLGLPKAEVEVWAKLELSGNQGSGWSSNDWIKFQAWNTITNAYEEVKRWRVYNDKWGGVDERPFTLDNTDGRYDGKFKITAHRHNGQWYRVYDIWTDTIDANQSSKYTYEDLPTGNLELTAGSVEGWPEYQERTFLLTNTGNENINLDVYLLKQGQATLASFGVKDLIERKIEGVLVTAMKNIDGNYVEVSQGYTDSEGIVLMWLDPNTKYKVKYEKEGMIEAYKEIKPNQPTTYWQTVPSEPIEFVDYTSLWEDVNFRFTPTSTALEDQPTQFTFMVSSFLNQIEYVNFVIKGDDGQVLYNDTVDTSPSGSEMTATIDLTAQRGDIKTYGTFKKTGHDPKTVKMEYHIWNITPSDYSMKAVMDDLADLEYEEEGIGQNTLAFISVIVLALVMGGVGVAVGAEGAGIVGIIGLIFLGMLGVIHAGLIIVISLTIVSIMYLRWRT